MPILLALPQTARGKTIKVGNGMAASCTESALRSALTFAEGEKNSTIQFKCGPDPATIVITATLTVPDNTTMNGDGLITLDGQFQLTEVGFGSILRVATGSTVVLKNLNVVRGGGCFPVITCGSGGGIFNEGNLTIQSCTFSGNVAFLYGGAIFNQGTLTVQASMFSDNNALGIGGGIFSQGTLSITGSTFIGNTSTFGGGIFAQGVLALDGSTFSHNGTRSNEARFAQAAISVVDPGSTPGGGAVWISAGTHTISTSTFTENNVAAENGGAIEVAGAGRAVTLTIKDTIISNNSIGTYGGAIANEGGSLTVTTIKNSRISGNRGSQGGAIWNGATLVIVDSTLTENVGPFGGAIQNRGNLIVKNSTITQNSAPGFQAGLGLGDGIFNLGRLLVQDSTITANVAGSNGGGMTTHQASTESVSVPLRSRGTPLWRTMCRTMLLRKRGRAGATGALG
jgi:predicted outer membrane repeat protein